jgi:predicted membrane protein (TIGR00267 family)
LVRNNLIGNFVEKLRQIGYPSEILHEVINDEYARRAFANNAFDGALTFLGILMGNLVLTVFLPSTIIKIGLSTCLAIGMSGVFGRFLSERAERKRVLKQMERDLFTADLSDSRLGREARKKILLISLIDGISPSLAALIPLAPFFFAHASVIPVNVSIVCSFILVFAVLFGLGMFLGKTSEESVLTYGLSVVAIGFITSLIIFLASIYFH